MTDVDPKIWENQTLGSVGAGPFLDEVEAQAKEDYNARREGREPRVAFHPERYPKYPELNVPSYVSTLEMLPPGSDVDNPPVTEDKVEVIGEDSPVAEDPVVPDFNFNDPTVDVDKFLTESGNDDSNSSE